MEIQLSLTSAGPHCHPIACEAGDKAFLRLKEGFEDRTADGSGVLVADIAAAILVCSSAGEGKWLYTFDIPNDQIAAGAAITPESVANACCVECGTRALLDKLAAAQSLDYNTEVFRVFEDGEAVAPGETRLLRRHTGIRLHSMEVSAQSIEAVPPVTSGGSAPDPGKLTVRPIVTPEQAQGPWSEAVPGSPGAVLDSASSTPLTARYAFSPPFVLDGGKAFGVNHLPDTEGAYHGLEVHLQFATL